MRATEPVYRSIRRQSSISSINRPDEESGSSNLMSLPEGGRRVAVRERLLRYCELDTLAMAQFYERLASLV